MISSIPPSRISTISIWAAVTVSPQSSGRSNVVVNRM
jgi:hypothetical protein